MECVEREHILERVWNSWCAERIRPVEIVFSAVSQVGVFRG